MAARAKQRLLAREIEGQVNIEQIVEQAALALPSTVSADPVNESWRRKFFQEAENVCEFDMQVLWGKVLAGEIERPGAYSLRTLETLRQLSKGEAELFRRVCGMAMADGWVVLPDPDINTALVPFNLDFDSILGLEEAGLLVSHQALARKYDVGERLNSATPSAVHTNNGILIGLFVDEPMKADVPCIIFSQAGRELQKLIEKTPNEPYLAAMGAALRRHWKSVRRGSFIPQNEGTSIVVFEEDL